MRKILILVGGLLLSFTIFAINKTASKPTEISLYEQPNTSAKVVSILKPNQPLLPIFSQGDWTKVGNPSNGDVGWISNKTLETMGMPRIYVKTFTKDNNGQGLQMVQYSGTQALNEKQMQEMIKHFQQQQMLLQRNFNSMLQQSIIDFNNFAKQFQQ